MSIEFKAEPNPKYLDGNTPKITILGKEWPVPTLGSRQLRHVVPAGFRLSKMFKSFEAYNAVKRMNDLALSVDKDAKLSPLPEVEITEQEYDDLILIVFWGLRRAHDSITFEAFSDAPISTKELTLAATRVLLQTRLDEEGGSKQDTGEEKARE